MRCYDPRNATFYSRGRLYVSWRGPKHVTEFTKGNNYVQLREAGERAFVNVRQAPGPGGVDCRPCDCAVARNVVASRRRSR